MSDNDNRGQKPQGPGNGGPENGGGEVKLSVEKLPREILRRLARRAIGTVRADAEIVAPEWTEAANIESLLDSLMVGKRTTQAGIIASVRSDVWRFREAPPRRTAA